LLGEHGDYHLAFGDSFSAAVDLAMDNPSSLLAGEAFLERVFTAYRSATAETGPNVWNTPLLIGWDEPGGTYDHVQPGPVPPPDPAAPPGEFGFTFDRSGYRVPALIVSPWVEPGSAYNEEYRHTSLIATLRKPGDWVTRSPSAMPRLVRSTTSSRSPHPRPAKMGDPHNASGARLDDEPRGGRPGIKHPGQRRGTRAHRQGQRVGSTAAGRAHRAGSRTATRADHRVLRQVAGHFFPLLAGDATDPDELAECLQRFLERNTKSNADV
jgi:Phosphoesterase family